MNIDKLDRSWTLFLDRDGVINKKLNNDFVLDWDEFEYCNLAIPAILILANYFGKIVVVTNQRCVDEGLLLNADLEIMHNKLLSDIAEHGDAIDKIYFCPHTRESNCNCRKPKTGMAFQAQEDFPEIDFTKSIMVGDSYSDLDFGKRLKMKTVFINKVEEINLTDSLADSVFESLFEFATYIDNNFVESPLSE